MSLRIRRGTDAQRTSKTFDLGEIVWTTDTQKLYVGDGLTAGGINALAAMAGVGFTFNATTQKIDFSLPNLNLNTSEVAENSANLYFTTTRAQASVAAALTAGNPYNSGIAFTYDNINNRITAVATGTQVPSTTGNIGKYLTVGDDGSVQWHNPPIPGGLSVPSFSGNQGKYLTTDGSILTWANIAINTLSYTTVGNVTYNANLTDTGFTMPVTIKLAPGVDIKRDNGSGIFTTVLGGLSSVSADTSPTLGGNLSLGNHNITGTGNINTTGTITASSTITGGSFTTGGTISTTQGLGADLSLNSHSITGVGNITPSGSIHAVGGNVTADAVLSGNTLSLTNGLASDLPLNGHDITSTGNININGNITSTEQIQGYTIVGNTIQAVQGLGGDLSLNSYSLTGTGGINILGAITANGTITGGGFNTTGTITASSTVSGGSLTTSGTITATQGLGANLSLNSHNITGSGNLNITGNVNLNLNSSLNIRELLDGVHNYGYIITAMSRGTFASPTAVQAGDELGGIIFQAYTDSSTQAIAGQISFIVDSNSTVTPGSGYVKSFVVISAATDTDQNANNAVTIDSAGVITSNAISVGDGSTAHPSIVFTTDGGKDSGFFHPGDGVIGVTINGVEKGRWNPTGLQVAGAIKTGSFNGSGSYPTPSAGMIIFDSSNNHFYGYDGSTWKQLDN